MRFSVAGGTWAIAVQESANSYFGLRPGIARSSSQITNHYFGREPRADMLMFEPNETDGFPQ